MLGTPNPMTWWVDSTQFAMGSCGVMVTVTSKDLTDVAIPWVLVEFRDASEAHDSIKVSYHPV